MRTVTTGCCRVTLSRLRLAELGEIAVILYSAGNQGVDHKVATEQTWMLSAASWEQPASEQAPAPAPAPALVPVPFVSCHAAATGEAATVHHRRVPQSGLLPWTTV